MAASGALGRREKEIDQWVRWKNRKEVKALFLDEYANAVLLGLVIGLELAAVEDNEGRRQYVTCRLTHRQTAKFDR